MEVAAWLRHDGGADATRADELLDKRWMSRFSGRFSFGAPGGRGPTVFSKAAAPLVAQRRLEKNIAALYERR